MPSGDDDIGPGSRGCGGCLDETGGGATGGLFHFESPTASNMDARYGHLRTMNKMDFGYRHVVAES